jgi:hypothetical protein
MNNSESREWITSIMSEISASERHFNNLQARYRMIASTWLLGTFAAIGFILAKEIKFDSLCPEQFIMAIALASAIGVYLLWTLDLMVYHRLLDAWFIEGYLFEKRHPWLPPVRSTMWKFCGKGILNRVVAYYLVSEGIVQAIAITALCFWMNKNHPKYSELALAVSVLAALFVLYRIWRSTGNTADLLKKRESEDEKTSDKAVLSEV